MALACLTAATSTWAGSAVPAEIQPQRQARTTQAAVPTCSYKCAKTPGLIIVGNAKAAQVATATPSYQRIRTPRPAEIQPQRLARPVQVAAPTRSYQRIRTPSLIIAGGPQSAVPAEIQPQRLARPVQVAAPTRNNRRIRTPGLLIVGW